MFTDPIHFYITNSKKNNNSSDNLLKLYTYLNTVGGVRASKTDDGNIEISYEDSPIKAILEINKNNNPDSDTEISQEFMLTCEREDSVALNLMRLATKSIGYRIYNPDHANFIVTEPNLMDLTNVKVNTRLIKLFKLNNLTPLFQYRGSNIFYAKSNSDNSIHLVNEHLLSYIENPKIPLTKEKQVSVKVAEDIGSFVALFDRGAIPTSFYKVYLHPNPKIVNLNGYDFEKLDEDIFFTPIFFRLNIKMQQFKQLHEININEHVEKSTNLIKHIKDTTNRLKLGDDFIVAKVGSSINYQQLDGKLYPRLTFSIFIK